MTRLWLQIQALIRRRKFDRDLDEELRFHLDMRQRRHQERGLSPESAHYAALPRFGNTTRSKEDARRMRTFPKLESLWHDLRWAARSLRRSPGFAAAVVLSLALGIGANTTIFSALNAAIFRPLPYPDPGRLMVIWQYQQGQPNSDGPPPIAEVVDWNRQNHVFEDIAQTSGGEPAPMGGLREPELVDQQSVTPNYFHVLGASPELGRIFRKDEIHDQVQTILISDSFWARRFNRDPAVLGRTFDLNAVESTVVGIMPPGFGDLWGEPVDVWAPINPESVRYSERKDRGWLVPVGRLKPGVTREQAQVEMNVIARRLEREYPLINAGMRDRVVPLREVVSSWAASFYPLMGAVAFVLLIACLNVANLLQSRTQTHRREQAVRASIGAGRLRLIQQLLAESALLAVAGGALSIGFTIVGIRLFGHLARNLLPSPDSLVIDVRVLLFTFALSMFTVLLFGVAPAVQASRPDLNAALRAGGTRTVAGSRGWTRHSLAIAETALAMVLLVGAGLMIHTVMRLEQINPGFDPANVMVGKVSLPEGGKYVERVPGGDMEKASPLVTAFYRQLLDKLAAAPGIASSGFMSTMMRGITFSIMGRPVPAPDRRPEAVYTEVSPSFFDTLRIPLKRGRYLSPSDRDGAPWVVVVNETFARRRFPNEDPIGHQVLLRYESYHIDEIRPREIVGVVGDVKPRGRRNAAPPMVYASYLQQPAVFPGGCIMSHLWQTIVTRTRGRSQEDFASAIRKAAAAVDPNQPVTDIMSMDRFLDRPMNETRVVMTLLQIFAGLALLLAVTGIYGVMSYFVSERVHEIGIRIALGAERANVLRLVTGLGLKLTFIGVAAGAALALALTRLIAGFLFGVSAADPATFAIVAAILVSIALLASWVPAHRATKVDPMVALRDE